MKILVLNGPNMNLLGKREPGIYGHDTLSDIEKRLKKLALPKKDKIEFFQSNHEGDLIDRMQKTSADAVIINPAGLTHSSVSLRDALASLAIPKVEVHISNIYSREEFRHVSLISGACTAVISGFGTLGYDYALQFLISHEKKSK